MQHQYALLLLGFNWHNAPGWPSDGLANRFSIGGIVLLPLNIGLYVSGRNKSDIVAKTNQLACPEMGCSARFNTDQAGRKLCEKRDNLASSQPPSEQYLSIQCNAVGLENVLGNIKPYCGNLFMNGSPML